jgi:Flp pilus assembly protein TadD
VIAHLQKKDFPQAEKAAKTIVESYPEDARAPNLLGTVYMLQGDAVKARQQFVNALKIDPKMIIAQLNLADIDQRGGDIPGAIERYQKVLELDKANISAMVKMAQITERQGDRQKAVEWLEKARQVNAEALAPRFLLARYYMSRNEVAKVLELSDEMIAKYPDQPEVLAVRGTALLSAGKTQESIDVFNKLVERQPDAAISHFRLGQAYHKAGNLEQARASFEQALKRHLFRWMRNQAIFPGHISAFQHCIN